MGQLGYNITELYEMTPKMFFNAQLGMWERWEVETQRDWDRTRWLGAVTINPHTKRNVQPKDLATFEWEKKRRRKVLDAKGAEKIRAEAKLYKKIMKKIHQKNG